MMAILLCIAWPVQAKIYTVKLGDTLGGIVKVEGSSVSELARINGIVDKNKIKVGQKLEIPEKGNQKIDQRQADRKSVKTNPVIIDGMIWRKVGVDPYRGTLQWAVEHFDIPASIKEATLRNIANNKFQWVNIDGNEWLGAVTFGKNKIAKNVLTGWDQSKKYSAKNYGVGDYVVAKVSWCQNMVWLKKGTTPTSTPSMPEEQNKAVIEEKTVAVVIPQEGPRKPPCKECPDQGEVDSGVYWIVHDPGGPNENKGWGAFGEILFWRNFTEDCSSEYSWGVGALASTYGYTITNKPESGDGYRLAAQGGVKRIWTREDGLSSKWIAKGRLGIESSHWENSDRDWRIDQIGPVAGFYGEYRHELVYDKIWLFATVESWFGLGSQSVDSSFSDTKAASRTFVEAVVGVDVRITDQDIARAYAGFDYQGYDDLFPGVIGFEIRHELLNDWGTVALGIQGKFYSTINPTALLYAKWEITKPIARWYDNCRQDSVQLVGTGIGGNQLRPETAVKASADHHNMSSTSNNRMDAVVAGLGNANSNR